MFRLFYNTVVVPIVFLGAYFAALFSKKIYKSIKVRSRIIDKIKKQTLKINPYKTTVLFHCSSLGEYKQILPLINEFLEDHEEYNIVLSLFSPSAYENLVKAPPVDIVTYTPFDFYFQTKHFLNIIKPDIVIISKHDVWPNFIFELKNRDIPVYLVNALFPPDSKMDFFLARPFFRKLFSNLSGIITVDEDNKKRFEKIYKYKDRLHISGDSRFDTVIYDALKARDSEVRQNLSISSKTFVAGSSWSAGEKIIVNSWKSIKEKFKDSFLILVPHEVDTEHIYKIEALCQENELSYVVYSEVEDFEEIKSFNVLIVDKIGILSQIYGAASIAYVGGGFGRSGLHSVLEPAAYGIPVMFGYNLDKSPEAKDMTKSGCGFRFYNDKEFISIVEKLWGSDEEYEDVCSKSMEFINEHKGATNRIMEILLRSIERKRTQKHVSFTEEELQRLIESDEL